jgi:Acetyltransferase (GNAT) family
LPENSTTAQGTRRSIENFRGDYQALADLLQRSWSENAQQSLYYSPEFLQSFLTAPGAGASLEPSFYRDETLVAFAAGFRRQVVYRGQSLNLATNTFLSVLPEHKKSGLGIVLWTDLVKRIRSEGFDGMINFCVDGEPMNRMIEGSCQRLGLPVQRIFSVRYMSSLLRAADFSAVSAPASTLAVDEFLNLAGPLVSSLPLARQWSTQEAEWQLQRAGAVVAHVSNESRLGFLTGYTMSILDEQRTKVLLLEDILWHDLQPDERLQLLRQFLSQAVSHGAQMATVPVLGYADLTAFKKLRFFPTRRVLHCYLTLFRDDLPLETLPAMYLDVF